MKGKVDRKIVKQTVMTTVYGVTLIGARDQIRNRLHETYGEGGSNELDERQVCMLACECMRACIFRWWQTERGLGRERM